MRPVRVTRVAFVAAFAAIVASAADAKVLIEIDKSAQLMSVSVDGARRWTWPVSTGRLHRDTPSGSYRAFRMERDHFSREWDDAPMPHSIFFTKRGHAIHGSLEAAKIGAPASAGCVRLAPDNAAKLFALVEEQGVLNTTVVIGGDVRVALARTAPQRTARTNRGGDGAATTPRRPNDDEELDEPRFYRAPPRGYARRYYDDDDDERRYARRGYYYDPRSGYYIPRGYYVPREYQVPRGYYVQPYYAPYSGPYYRTY